MTNSIQDLLGSAFESYRIEKQIHDVPPHEVYEVSVDGRRAVCKRNVGPTGMAHIEGRVLDLVDTHSSVAVPEVLWLDGDAFVAAWHPDAPTPDTETGVTPAWATAAGRGLATLHAETESEIEGYGRIEQAGDGITVDGDENWHSAAIEYLQRERAVLAEYGHGDVATRAIETLQDRPDCFEGAGSAVCVHGWWTPEHVAVADGKVRCVVDFEHAMAAPGEFDYWRATVPRNDFDEKSLEAFRRGYESVRLLPEGFERRRPYYLLLVLVYFFESLYVQDQHSPAETEQKATALRESTFELLEDL